MNITEICVNDNKVSVLKVGDVNYISLTDLARYADLDEPKTPIQNWMRNKDVILYLGLWERINNNKFKGIEFDTFKNEAGSNRFSISPQRWIKVTNAVGMISKSGRYGGGTFAHPDIAFEFASWLSPEFKLYLITEFERLKKKESLEQSVEWNVSRILAKTNYLIQTSSIKKNLAPILTDKQKKYIYAEEADVLNVALFGMTAKEWREENPELAKKGNVRDYADLISLIILSNLENINAELIENNIPQTERLIKLNNIARRQFRILDNNNIDNNLMKL